MKKYLIVIDMQKDFVDGVLGSPEAVSAVSEVVREVTDPAYTKVYATMDTHTPEYMSTLEGKYLPVPHCIRDTEGWQINEQIAKALRERNAVIVEKGTFGSTDMAVQIAAEKPDEITLCGVCTDICVVSNALLLRAYLPNTEIHVKAIACAGTTPENHEAALKVMKSCQIITEEE